MCLLGLPRLSVPGQRSDRDLILETFFKKSSLGEIPELIISAFSNRGKTPSYHLLPWDWIRFGQKVLSSQGFDLRKSDHLLEHSFVN